MRAALFAVTVLMATSVFGTASAQPNVPVAGEAALRTDGPVGQCAPPSQQVNEQMSWAQRRMASDRVWPLTRGTGIVGVVDTGVSAEAPALAGAVLPGTNLVGGRGDGDCFGRGTFIAGLIAARPAGGPFTGVAPGVRVFPVRVSDDPPRIQDHAALATAIGNGIRASVDAGARVVAVGLVATLGVPQLEQALAYAAQRDVVVVASVSAPRSGQLTFPARYPGVLAVAPIGPTGPPQQLLHGAQPILAAPGQELVSIGPRGPGHRGASGGELAVGYVAGVVALVRSYHPALKASQVIERLTATADPPGGAVPDEAVGFGVVNPFAAVTTLMDTGPPPRPVTEHLAVPHVAVPDEGPARRALWFAGAIAAVALLAVGPAVAVAQRRSRRRTE
ncbi:MAG: S8 family serine peptidase [Kibdelosporangium sp.]